MGPAHTLLWFVQLLQPEAEQEGNSQVPCGSFMVRGARSDEQHCDMSDKTRLFPAVQTPGNNSPAAVRKAFSWGGLGGPSRTTPWSVTPPCSPPALQSPRSPLRAWKARVRLVPTWGTAPAMGPQMLRLHVPIFKQEKLKHTKSLCWNSMSFSR